jgi:hypothetical protein
MLNRFTSLKGQIQARAGGQPRSAGVIGGRLRAGRAVLAAGAAVGLTAGTLVLPGGAIAAAAPGSWPTPSWPTSTATR